MKLMIIRHADPDYEKDSLTPAGWKEAEALSERMKELPVDYVYTSPLGRARDTASLSLQKLGMEAVVCSWMREFSPPYILYPSTGARHICWDWLPEDWTVHREFFDRDKWSSNSAFEEASVRDAYDETVRELDLLLARHGYERDGDLYRVRKSSRELIVFFCHYGVQCVMLSHLLNISPMLLWHGTVAQPSSVTTLCTEERREGKAYFRMQTFGDISHLHMAGLEPSFAARFCETYDSWEERHD